MPAYITTLKDDDKTNDMLPRTVLKAIADDNGAYLDSGLQASDINYLKNGKTQSIEQKVDNLVTQSITDGDTSHAPSGDAVNDALNAISTTQTSAIGATPSIETKVSSSSNSVSFSIGGYEAFLLLARGNSMQGEIAIGHMDSNNVTIDLRFGGTFQISFSNGTLTVTNSYDNGIRVTLIKSMTVYE